MRSAPAAIAWTAAGSPASHAGGAPFNHGTLASSRPLPMSATTGTSSVARSASLNARADHTPYPVPPNMNREIEKLLKEKWFLVAADLIAVLAILVVVRRRRSADARGEHAGSGGA